MEKPPAVYWSLLQGDRLAMLSFDDRSAAVRCPGGRDVTLAPYAIGLEAAGLR